VHLPTANSTCKGTNLVVHRASTAARITGPITESLTGVSSWVHDAEQRAVEFDALGRSAYERYQGPASGWRATFGQLACAASAPCFWEPTLSGPWGDAIFTRQGNRYVANAAAFAGFDQMRRDYGL